MPPCSASGANARMSRVAVFGNAGGGKSTLARELARLTGLPLHPLDLIRFLPGGGEVPQADYERAHAAVMAGERWIIEGYGCPRTLWPRLERADTLVYLDLPLARHCAWVLKRLVQGLVRTPEGWPPGSAIWKGSISSLRVLRRCHRDLTPRYRAFVQAAAGAKRVHHLRSPAEIRAFLHAVQREESAPDP